MKEHEADARLAARLATANSRDGVKRGADSGRSGARALVRNKYYELKILCATARLFQAGERHRDSHQRRHDEPG